MKIQVKQGKRGGAQKETERHEIDRQTRKQAFTEKQCVAFVLGGRIAAMEESARGG